MSVAVHATHIRRVICLGSRQGGDAVAWILAERLESHLRMHEMTGLEIHCSASPLQMLELFGSGIDVTVIDATRDLPPGSVQDIGRDTLLRSPRCSSHGVDLHSALELADALHTLPGDVRILAIGVGTEAVDPAGIAAQAWPEVLAQLEIA